MSDIATLDDPITTLDKAVNTVGKFHRLAREKGLPDDMIRQTINDQELMRRLIEYWKVGCYHPTPSQQGTQKIIGLEIFGIEQAIKHFRVNVTPEDEAALAEIPYSLEMLRACQKTHRLVAYFPLSVYDSGMAGF